MPQYAMLQGFLTGNLNLKKKNVVSTKGISRASTYFLLKDNKLREKLLNSGIDFDVVWIMQEVS